MSTKVLGIILLFLAVNIEAVAQLSLKQAAIGGTTRISHRLWLGFGISCFVIEAIVWTLVLSMLDVSVAYPMGSLSFVAIAVLSSWFLREKITPERWLGVVFIIGGTALVGLT